MRCSPMIWVSLVLAGCGVGASTDGSDHTDDGVDSPPSMPLVDWEPPGGTAFVRPTDCEGVEDYVTHATLPALVDRQVMYARFKDEADAAGWPWQDYDADTDIDTEAPTPELELPLNRTADQVLDVAQQDGGLLVVADGWEQVRVVDVSDPWAPRLRSSVASPTRIWGVLLHDTTLVIAHQDTSTRPYWTGGLTLVDLSDPDAPEVVREIVLPRQFSDVQLTDGHLSFVTTWSATVPGWDDLIESLDRTDLTDRDGIAELFGPYARHLVHVAPAGTWRPQLLVDGEPLDVPCTRLFHPPEVERQGSWTVLTEIDLTDPALTPVPSAFLAGASLHRASPDHAWLVEASHPNALRPWRDPVSTRVQSLVRDEDGALGPGVTVRLSGAVLNHFSASAMGDTLRVATSAGSDGVNQVAVLQPGPREVRVIGEVSLDGPGQSLYAAHFSTDTAWLTAVEDQQERLWRVDLTTPTRPTRDGVVTVPREVGDDVYTKSWLSPLGADRMLAIGGARLGGDEGRQPVLELYDLADPERPARLEQIALGGIYAGFMKQDLTPIGEGHHAALLTKWDGQREFMLLRVDGDELHALERTPLGEVGFTRAFDTGEYVLIVTDHGVNVRARADPTELRGRTLY